MLRNFLMNKKKTVIFGGSFNPVHSGHVALARQVCDEGLASEVWFMVSPQNPHKTAQELAPEQHRLRMVQLAIAGDSRLKASDFEFSLPRPSYTVNTLSALEGAFSDREFVLLIGADNWEKFDKWYKGDEIITRYRIIVYPRGEENIQTQLPQGVTWLNAPLHDISSTQVRGMVANGADVSSLVSDEVATYIVENELYK